MAKHEKTKEFKELMKAINKWIGKHEGRVTIACSIIAWKKGSDIYDIDDRLIAYGNKKELIIHLQEMLKLIKKEKKNQINW